VFSSRKIQGTVCFTQEVGEKRVAIDVKLSGLKKNALHGFHVHEYGDMSEKCESMCAHFNPTNQVHGAPGQKHRHVGDLGNLKTDANGIANYRFFDDVIQLKPGKFCIVGRGLIIHADPDDCGHGENDASLVNGNAGKRIACSVIGIQK
jgi:Cu-Zn family superoxide dismutase